MQTYSPGENVIVSSASGPQPGVVQCDNGGKTLMVKVNNTSYWFQRERVTYPADHLATNEQPGPANAAYQPTYSGIMGERLNKRR